MPATQNVPATGNAYIDGLLSPQKWAVTTLTYGFPTLPQNYSDAYGSSDEPYSNFEALNATQKAAAAKAFALIASYANIRFVEATGSAAATADLRQAMSDMPGTAYANLPTAFGRG